MLKTLLELAGVAMIVAGVALWSTALALVVGGLIIVMACEAHA